MVRMGKKAGDLAVEGRGSPGQRLAQLLRFGPGDEDVFPAMKKVDGNGDAASPLNP
jgi:hypothetical protein